MCVHLFVDKKNLYINNCYGMIDLFHQYSIALTNEGAIFSVDTRN